MTPDNNALTNVALLQHPALWAVGACCAGITFDRYFDVPIGGYAVIMLIATAVFFSSFCLRTFHANRLIATLFFIGSLSACWHHAYWNFYPTHEVSQWASVDPHAVCITATLLNEPRVVAATSSSGHLNRPRDQSTQNRMLVRCLSIRNGEQWSPAAGRLQVTAPASAIELHAGDQVKIWGTLRKIGGPTNPGEFDFRHYYRSQRILCSMYCAHADGIEITRRSQSGVWLARLRSRLNELAWHHLAPQQASLASAILLGNREQLESSRRENFLQTGTVHLLAISGLHVGILACCFFAIFRCGWLSRNACLLLTIAFVLFYAWLVEFRPPVVRASILIVLFCAARMSGRSGLSYNVLALAALIVLAINPTDLFALGTQLSFLAVISISFGNKWIFKRQTDPLIQLIEATRSWPVRIFYFAKDNLRAAFVVSGLIWLISIPLVAINFHVLAPIGLIVNPLILLPIAVSLYTGIAIFVFGDFFGVLATVAAIFCTISLSFIESFVGWASQVPYGHFWTAGPPFISVVIFYVGWLVFGLFPPTRLSIRRLFTLSVAWVILCWGVPVMAIQLYHTQIQRTLTTTFIDVGHGTAVLLELPNGKVLMYDCGSTISSRFATRSVSDVLWHKGIGHIDTIVVSHADIDHFNGIPELTDRFSIGTVYLSPMMKQHPSPSVAELKQSLSESNITTEELVGGDTINIDPNVSIAALAPFVGSAHANDNSASIVLSIEYQHKKILLPGDLEKEGLEHLLAKPPSHFDLIMAAHHGSSHSAPNRFCQWTDPDYIAVSCGNGKLSSAMKTAASAYDCQLLATETGGAIEFQIQSDGTTVFSSFTGEQDSP